MIVAVLVGVFGVLAMVVVLGFCAYELNWKLRRLRSDAERLERTVAELGAVQLELDRTRLRIAALGEQQRGK